MRKRYGMVIDTRVCISCGNCVMGCKAENVVPEGLHRVWVVEEESGVFPHARLESRSERCNHCEDPPCVSSCPTGASFIFEGSNITLVNPDECTGCKSCVASCPYDARYIEPGGYIGKCTFCVHKLGSGEQPSCASVCPTDCIQFGDFNDPNSQVSRSVRTERTKVLHEAAGTNPNIYYIY